MSLNKFCAKCRINKPHDLSNNIDRLCGACDRFHPMLRLTHTKSVLFRPIRELLEDAMKEVVSISSLEEIRGFYMPDDPIFHMKGKLKVRHYCFDSRINWDTWLVVDEEGRARGYTNGYLPETEGS